MFKETKGRHWVFIVGFLSIMIMGFVNTEVAMGILQLLFLIGLGIVVCKY